MRIDHLAFRSINRHETAKFFVDAFGYRIQQEFIIDFEDGNFADCVSLEPPEKLSDDEMLKLGLSVLPWQIESHGTIYHLAPEIFISDGNPGSIVGDWVVAKGGSSLHHIAYQVDNVSEKVMEWRNKGYAEFSSDPIECPEDDLIQVFTKPSKLTGVVYEFIKRGHRGFCRQSVRNLMESSK
jgi:catechol 2,3-dioxygenase-like lactoylglutathione lyase family enzyme